MKDPAFLFYSKDWIEGTAEYMPEEKGVYIDLLCFQHQRGGIPNNTERLAKMVGLSIEKFEKIWSVISEHFEPNGDRLVNRKLNQVMTERSEKSKINTITGTFAGMLRLGNFNKKTYNYLKSNFKVTNFISYSKENITERLTEWLTECLKSIEDGNEDVIINEYEYLLPEIKETFLKWLKYKAEKKQKYASIDSEKQCYNHLMKISDNNTETAKAIIEKSIACNYAGLFPVKENKTLQPKQEPQPAYLNKKLS
jgi:hypothetical protein